MTTAQPGSTHLNHEMQGPACYLTLRAAHTLHPTLTNGHYNALTRDYIVTISLKG